MESITEKKIAKPRLHFIDMARSIAILMMIEGHFTGAALANQYRDDANFFFGFWHNMHGLTSPLFFSVTGVIFVYLMIGNKEVPYFQNMRVKKGFKRVLELLFWGYMIQLNLWSIGKSLWWGTPINFDWFYAFHVLQSIAFGLTLILLIYGLFKIIGKLPLHFYYFIAAAILFVFYSFMKHKITLDESTGAHNYWPAHFPKIIQNMFYGQYSDFSFVRFSGYTLLGGMVGSIIKTYEVHAKKWWFGLSFIIIGIALNMFIIRILNNADHMLSALHFFGKTYLALDSTSFVRFGQVLIVLGVLMLVDANIKYKPALFLKLGQNTLQIYIVHVIILYGGIIGFGLKPLVFDLDKTPLESIAIAISAMVAFTVMVKYIEPLSVFYNKIFAKIRIFKDRE